MFVLDSVTSESGLTLNLRVLVCNMGACPEAPFRSVLGLLVEGNRNQPKLV